MNSVRSNDSEYSVVSQTNRTSSELKKVLIISGSLPPIKCGVGYYTHRLVKEMLTVVPKAGVSVLSTDDITADLPIPLATTANWRISNLRNILRQIDAVQAEIIHIEYPTVGYKRELGINLLAYWLRFFKSNRKLIVTLHEYHGSRWIGRARNFITAWPAHRVVVSNNADLLALPSPLRRKALIIPIGSNLNKYSSDPNIYKRVMAGKKLDPAKPTLLFFGFAFANKGLETLLESMELEPLTSYQLLLLSGLDKSDAYQSKLLDRINKINKGMSRIAVAGFLPDRQVSAIMQEVDYFVLPQAQPLTAKSSTAITAITHNLVLISKASADAKQTEPFVHRQNCYLLDEMTPGALAETISELAREPRLVKRIKNTTKNLSEYFAWQSIVKKHLSLYRER